MMETREKVAKVRNRVGRIHKLLQGLPPEVQGAILADLLATWLVGYPPQLRQEILNTHITGMIPLIAANERALFPAGHPLRAGAATKSADTTH